MSDSLSQMKKEFEADYKVEPDLLTKTFFDDEVLAKYRSVCGVDNIQADRENDYGDAKVSHQSIGVFWNEYLQRKGYDPKINTLDATDVAVMLSLMKVSRLAYKRKHDSVLDFASYADFALQFEEENK